MRLADRAYAAYFERPPQLKGSRYAAVGRLKGRLKSLVPLPTSSKETKLLQAFYKQRKSTTDVFTIVKKQVGHVPGRLFTVSMLIDELVAIKEEQGIVARHGYSASNNSLCQRLIGEKKKLLKMTKGDLASILASLRLANIPASADLLDQCEMSAYNVRQNEFTNEFEKDDNIAFDPFDHRYLRNNLTAIQNDSYTTFDLTESEDTQSVTSPIHRLLDFTAMLDVLDQFLAQHQERLRTAES